MTILRLIDVILAPTLTLFQKDSLSEFVYQLRGWQMKSNLVQFLKHVKYTC